MNGLPCLIDFSVIHGPSSPQVLYHTFLDHGEGVVLYSFCSVEPFINVPTILRSCHDSPDHGENFTPMPMHIIDPQDLIGCTFLMDKQDDGQHFHIYKLEDHK